MRMLFVSLIVVLFISGKLASPIEQTDVIEASGETENLNKNEDVPSEDKSSVKQLNNENEMPADVIAEPVKRSKKSNYPSAPYPSASYPSAPYPSAPYPSAPYPSAQYPSAPYPSAPYPSAQYPSAQYPSAQYPSAPYPSSLCPCSYNQGYAQPSVAYNQQQISYGQPSYGGYPASGPKYGRRKEKSYSKQYQGYQLGQQQLYQPPQPSYQPSYQPPQPSYQSPQPSYQSPPSYQSTSAPSYSAPSQSYSYPSRRPNVQCGSNVLVGCHPHVSQVPCSGYSPSYGNPGYAPQQYSTPTYRSNAEEEESSVTSSLLPPNRITETSFNKNNSTNPMRDDSAAPGDGMEKPKNSDSNNDGKTKEQTVSATNTQELSAEEARKKYETLLKMTKLAKELTNNDKGNPQQNQLPASNPIQTSENPSIPASALPGPQPTSINMGLNQSPQPTPMNLGPNQPPQATSMNMGMNQNPGNQQHAQFFTQPQQQQIHQPHQQQPQMRWVN